MVEVPIARAAIGEKHMFQRLPGATPVYVGTEVYFLMRIHRHASDTSRP